MIYQREKSELLGSRVRQWNLLHRATRVAVYGKRYSRVVDIFENEINLVLCKGVLGLIKKSLRSTRLTNGNFLLISRYNTQQKQSSIVPVAHKVPSKETHENLKSLQ